MNQFLQQLKTTPENISFESTMAVIDKHYNFSPCEFSNGDLINAENQNNGSCKIFSFALLHNLTEQQTLHCFGDYYREDVLQNPLETDHQNIRHFIQSGWTGIKMNTNPLTSK